MWSLVLSHGAIFPIILINFQSRHHFTLHKRRYLLGINERCDQKSCCRNLLWIQLNCTPIVTCNRSSSCNISIVYRNIFGVRQIDSLGQNCKLAESWEGSISRGANLSYNFFSVQYLRKGLFIAFFYLCIAFFIYLLIYVPLNENIKYAFN